MATELIMPKVDMDQETGTISEWKKHNGDHVKEGETILVIETAKVAIDVEAPATGILDGVSAQPGEVFPIGVVIGYILEPGEALPEKNAPEAQAATQAASNMANLPVSVEVTPVARKMAEALGIDLSQVSGSGALGKITRTDVEQAASKATVNVPPGKVNATPAARRIASEMGVDLTKIAGSGPAQRIQAADVSAFVPKPITGGIPVPMTEDDEVIPIVGMRATIAQRLTMSYQTIPHIKFTTRIDMTAFNEARKSMNTFAEKAGSDRISATAMFVKIVASALKQHPYLNASMKEDRIVLHKNVNMGVAVALDDGLIVPVVHDVTMKSISRIAAETNLLAEKARKGELQPNEVSGGTFTISNLGPFGIEQFDAIINPPQSAILAISTTQDEVVPVNGEVVIRPIMRITLSADHRIIDGAVAAKFIADLKNIFENPILILY
ncbi:MAG: 2-oxo acid dehydrogenase subunit E2 [Anaerolineaceae bacterium]|nr:2-oxo acid dehydrogenase subunit E2 [Anaerolineaceae bacterium]